MFPLTNLMAIEGLNSSIKESNDFVGLLPALTSIGITSPSFSIMNSSSESSLGL